MIPPALICPQGIHGAQQEGIETEWNFDDSLKEEINCCTIGDRINTALVEFKSTLTTSNTSASNENGQERAFKSFEISDLLQNRCRPAVIAWNADQCALIRDTQEQTKFRKKLDPFAIGSHLIHWPIYQTTLHVYFHYGVDILSEDTVIPIESDNLSGVTFPKDIVYMPQTYRDPIHPPENSTLKSFQFNLVVISSESYYKCQWHRDILKELIDSGKWGVIGNKHNFIIPFLFCHNKDTPDFVEKIPELIRYSFVLNQHGQFIGDLALKLILPIIHYTNQYYIRHFENLKHAIALIPEPHSSKDITEYIIALFNVYSAAHHLVIYCPLSTVIARLKKNRQLIPNIVNLIQIISEVSQHLIKLGGDLLMNAAIGATGIVGTIETGCKVDKRFMDLKKYQTVEGLLNGGLLWILASVPEYYLNTEFVKDKSVVCAGVEFLRAFFLLFISEKEVLMEPYELSSMTIYRFNFEKNLYLKTESTFDFEIIESSKMHQIPIEMSCAAPNQCMNTDAFRILHFLLQYVPEGIEVENMTKLLSVCLRLCLNRTVPVVNRTISGNRRDCVPVFPFKRWISVVGKDRFGNDKPGWANPFNPLFNILIYSIFFVQKNLKYKDFSEFLPIYLEVVFQIFNPISILADTYLMERPPPDSNMYNNKDIEEWAIKIGKLIRETRNRRDIDRQVAPTINNFFQVIIHKYWCDFESAKLFQLKELFLEKQNRVYDTKIPGVFGMLKFEEHLESHGPVTAESSQAQSYGDPVFEALHVQIPLLLFSPAGIKRYLFSLQNFAFNAHPVRDKLQWPPPHCYYRFRVKISPNPAQKSLLSLVQSKTETQEKADPQSTRASTSDLRVVNFNIFDRWVYPIYSVSSSTSDVSSHLSSARSVASLLENNEATVSFGQPEETASSEERSISNEENHRRLIVSTLPDIIIDNYQRELDLEPWGPPRV